MRGQADERFDTRQLPEVPDAVAPDGSDVRVSRAVGVTMLPWPGDDEACEVTGEWPADARP